MRHSLLSNSAWSPGGHHATWREAVTLEAADDWPWRMREALVRGHPLASLARWRALGKTLDRARVNLAVRRSLRLDNRIRAFVVPAGAPLP